MNVISEGTTLERRQRRAALQEEAGKTRRKKLCRSNSELISRTPSRSMGLPQRVGLNEHEY